MTRERIQMHINFLRNSVLDRVSGQTIQNTNSINKQTREAAALILDITCMIAEKYFDKNPDLKDFISNHYILDSDFLENSKRDSIERDTRGYIGALEEILLSK